MTAAEEQQPNNPRVSNADLSRRVERLEDVTSALSKSVGNVEHQLDIVKLGQEHQSELMNTKFTGLESLAAQTHSELKGVVDMIQKAMNATPEDASPQARAIMAEYRAFQAETREDIKALRTDLVDLDRRKHKLREEYDDHILVEETKHKMQANLWNRAFGGSVLGAVSGLIGLVLSIAALVALFSNHPPA